MKSTCLKCSWLGGLAGVAAAAVLCSQTAVFSAPGAEADEMRERATRMEEKARALKQEGRHGQASQLMREVEELRTQAARLVPGGEADRPAVFMKRQEMKAELLALRTKVEELKAAGRMAEAEEVAGQARKLERELVRLNRGEEEARDRGPQGRGPEGNPDLERRLRHLEIAVDNLHAAGLHEAADRLARERERLREESWQRPGPGGRPGTGPEMPQLRRELEEMRGTLEDLRRGLDATHRELEELRQSRK